MAHIRKYNKGWQARYRGPDGKERAKHFKKRVEAERFLTSVEASKLAGVWIDPRLGKAPFREVVAEWQQQPKRQEKRLSTRVREDTAIRVHVLPAFGDLPIRGIKWPQIEDWRDRDLKKLAPATVSRHLIILGQIFRYAQKRGMVAQNPVALVDGPGSGSTREDLFLEPLALNALADAAPGRYRALILLAGYRGLRFGELAGLRPQRLNLLGGYVDVAEKLSEVDGTFYFDPPKTDEGIRKVSLPKFLIQALQDHIENYPPRNDLVFTNADGSVLRRSNFNRRIWRPALKKAGIPYLRPHDLRHTAASILIAEGASIIEVGEILGWSKNSVTAMAARYAHLLPTRDQELNNRIERLYHENRKDQKVI